MCGVLAFLLSQARDLLLDQGLDVSAVRNDGATVLHLLTVPKAFSRTENLADSINLLFPTQVPVAMGKDGRYPIHEVCSSIDRFSIPVYSGFISLGMDPMLPDGKGKPCFELALEAVEQDIAIKSPPWQRLREAVNFLHFIVSQMSNNDVASLRRFSARIFHFGCRVNQDWVISLFLEMGFDVDLRDPNGILESGLEYACRYSGADIAGLILAHSAADLQSVVSGDLDLLSLACWEECSDDFTLKLLLDRDLDPNVTSSSINQTPLMVAAGAGNLQQVRLLLDRGADPNATTSLSKFNATYHACELGTEVVFDLFIEQYPQTATHLIPWDDYKDIGYDMDEINILHYAASCGLRRFIQRIISSGVIQDIDCASKLGFTALHAAAFADEASTVEFLLQKGADINKRTSEGDAAIHVAAEKGCDSIVDILLKENCVADGLNSDGETPYIIATISGHRRIAGKILAHIFQKGSYIKN
jgi:ankyrin repeat protein